MSSIKEITSKVRTQEAEKSLNKLDFSTEEAQKYWNAYMNRHNSPTQKATMKRSVLRVEEQVLIVEVESAMAKNVIQGDLLLLEGLRDHFLDPSIIVKVEIDEVKHAEIKKQREETRPLTNEEIYEEFVKRNNSMIDFQQRFDLKF